MNKVEDSTGGVEGDEGEARPFASAAEMAEALAAEPLARDFAVERLASECAASSSGGTTTAAEAAALAERTARERMAALAEDSGQSMQRAEEAARERFSSSLTPTGYTPASALLGGVRSPSVLRALGVIEPPGLQALREIRAAREAASILSPDLRRLLEFRELKSTLGVMRSLGMVRSAQRYEAPPAAAPRTPPTPPAPPPKDARALRKERAAAAAAKRGEELRAMEPKALLSRLRTMQRKGRKFAHVAADHGMTADELRALEQSAKPSAPPRKHRKRA